MSHPNLDPTSYRVESLLYSDPQERSDRGGWAGWSWLGVAAARCMWLELARAGRAGRSWLRCCNWLGWLGLAGADWEWLGLAKVAGTAGAGWGWLELAGAGEAGWGWLGLGLGAGT